MDVKQFKLAEQCFEDRTWSIFDQTLLQSIWNRHEKYMTAMTDIDSLKLNARYDLNFFKHASDNV